MDQSYLLIYLEVNGCEIVRRDKAGYCVVRNSATMSISGVPLPKNGKEIRHETVVLICKRLDVPIPTDTPEELERVLKMIGEDVKKRSKGE